MLVVVQIVSGSQPPMNLSGYKLQQLIAATDRYGRGRGRRQADGQARDPSVYIAANLTEADLANGFTLGDGKPYGAFINHELDPGVSYSVGFWSQVDGTTIPILNPVPQQICKSVWLESL